MNKSKLDPRTHTAAIARMVLAGSPRAEICAKYGVSRSALVRFMREHVRPGASGKTGKTGASGASGASGGAISPAVSDDNAVSRGVQRLDVAGLLRGPDSAREILVQAQVARVTRRSKWIGDAEQAGNFNIISKLDGNEGRDLESLAKWCQVDQSGQVTNSTVNLMLFAPVIGVSGNSVDSSAMDSGDSGSVDGAIEAEFSVVADDCGKIPHTANHRRRVGIATAEV